MALLDEALAYLVANTTTFKAASSTGSEVPIYLSHMPPEVPDTAVGLYEPGGAPPLAGLASSAPVVERPRIQVLSRSDTYETARDNCQVVWDTFFAVANADVLKGDSTGTTFWASAEPINSPSEMGEDALRRHIVSADFQIIKEMS
jgi:hypothetical protein